MNVDHDALVATFVGIRDRDLKAAIVAAINDAAFVDSLVAGGDSYLRVGVTTGKPESKEPAGVVYVREVRRVTRKFEAVSSVARDIAGGLDHQRAIHDNGTAAGESPSEKKKRIEKELRVLAHLAEKVNP